MTGRQNLFKDMEKAEQKVLKLHWNQCRDDFQFTVKSKFYTTKTQSTYWYQSKFRSGIKMHIKMLFQRGYSCPRLMESTIPQA